MRVTKQSGAASLFIVIFTALLVTVITVGFTQIMIRNQQQALASDLSQSAYDAALAGVEDAKRLLVTLAECDASPDPNDCANLADIIDAHQCSTTLDAGLTTKRVANTASEVQVGDSALNQAYTCVKINRFSTAYPGTITPSNPSVVIPISPHNGDATMLRVTWFTKEDVDQGTIIDSTGFFTPSLLLPKADDWSSTRPPVIRAQYVPASVSNDSLDNAAQTTFGYPKSLGVLPPSLDSPRRKGTFGLSLANCRTDFNNALGACSIDIPLNQSIKNSETAFVQLSALYLSGQLHVNVELVDAGGNQLELNGIPTVDSTGRAAERFRRVVAKIKVGTGVASERPQPRAALDVDGNICKTFFITDNIDHYQPGPCDPAG